MVTHFLAQLIPLLPLPQELESRIRVNVFGNPHPKCMPRATGGPPRSMSHGSPSGTLRSRLVGHHVCNRSAYNQQSWQHVSCHYVMLACAGAAAHEDLGGGQRAARAAADWRQHGQQSRQQRWQRSAAAANQAADHGERTRPAARARCPARLPGPGACPAQQQPHVGQRGRPEVWIVLEMGRGMRMCHFP